MVEHPRLNWQDPDLIQNPYPHYAALQSRAPLFFEQERGIWIVSGYDDCQRMLKDPRFTNDRFGRFLEAFPPEQQTELAPIFTVARRMTIFRDGLEHELIRTPLTRAIAMQAQKTFGTLVAEEVENILSPLQPGQTIDFFAQIAHPFPLRIICRMMGFPIEEGPKVKAWADAITRFIDVSTDLEVARKAHQAYRDFVDYISPIWKQRQGQEDKHDLLSLLKKVQDGHAAIHEDDIFSNILGLFLAGHETTTSLLTNGMSALFQEPEALASVRKDLSLLPQAIEEMLRFDGPVQRVGRAAREDLLWAEQYPIKRGQYVVLLLGAANRDPKEFEEPQRFMIQRAKNKHLSFGGGAHHCIGAQLARLESLVLLKALFTKFPAMSLIEPVGSYAPNLTFRCRTALRLLLK